MSTTLELRYRRLLALFPAAHRRVYEEEMIGVLLAAAGPDRRRPRAGEALDLIVTGLRLRLGRWGSGLGDRRWSAAAAVFGLTGALFLLVRPAEVLLARGVWTWRMPEDTMFVTSYTWVWLGGWLAVVVSVLAGWRIAAAVLAWGLAAVEAIQLGADYLQRPVGVLEALPPFVLEVIVAAALSVPNPRRAALAAFGRRRVVWFAIAWVLLLLGPSLDPALVHIEVSARGFPSISLPSPGIQLPLVNWLVGYPAVGVRLPTLAAVLVAVAIGLWLLVRLEPGTRRRVLVLAAAPALLAFTIATWFGGFEASSPQFDPPVLLEPVQWAVLVLVPLLTLVVGSALVDVLDRRAYLVELGRDAEQQPATTTTAPDGS